MFKTFIFSIILGFAGQAISQNKITDSTATIVSFWLNKEERIYKFEQNEISYKPKQEAETISTSYFAHVKVLDSSETGYTIEWVFRHMGISDNADPTSKKILMLAEGLRVLYTTSSSGAFERVENMDEIKYSFNKGFDLLELDSTLLPAAKAGLAQIRNRMVTDKAIDELFLEDIRYMHYLHGYEFNRNQALTYESELENVLGGESFPAQNELKLEAIEPALDNIRMGVSTHIDKEQGRKVVLSTLKAMAKASGKDQPSEVEAPEMVIDIHMDYMISIRTGWVTHFAYVKEVKYEELRNVKLMSIAMLE